MPPFSCRQNDRKFSSRLFAGQALIFPVRTGTGGLGPDFYFDSNLDPAMCFSNIVNSLNSRKIGTGYDFQD